VSDPSQSLLQVGRVEQSGGGNEICRLRDQAEDGACFSDLPVELVKIRSRIYQLSW
jgi:hypothetical protein